MDMTRKTKKQKIRARQRFLKAISEPVKREFSFTFENHLNHKTGLKNLKNAEISSLSNIKSQTIRDLVKSILIAISLLIIEVVIYFVLIKQSMERG